MSELAAKRVRSVRSRAVACFCEQCSRLLYVPESDVLFCPVCSSLVSRIEVDRVLEHRSVES